jgi:hypothetical protein
MQRKKEQQRYEKRHQKQHDKSSSSSMDVDDTERDESMTPVGNNGDNIANSSDCHPRQSSQDSLVAAAPGTTSDMYGISVDVIGRRSFGGFNRAIEDTWKSSYRSHREGVQRTSKEKASDDELLQRYANIVKQRLSGAGGDDDMSRRPVGNLGEKGQRNKQRGEKRKRR